MLRRIFFCFGLLLQRFQRRDRDEGRRDGGRDSGAGADRERQRRERLQQQKRGQWNAYWQDKNAPRNVYNSSVCGVTPERCRCLFKRLGMWFQVPVGEGLQFRTHVMTYYWRVYRWISGLNGQSWSRFHLHPCQSSAMMLVNLRTCMYGLLEHLLQNVVCSYILYSCLHPPCLLRPGSSLHLDLTLNLMLQSDAMLLNIVLQYNMWHSGLLWQGLWSCDSQSMLTSCARFTLFSPPSL